MEKEIALERYLDCIGYTPAKRDLYELHYISPFNMINYPSFVVNELNNTWYDFGIDAGGDIRSFVMLYYNLDCVSDISSIIERDLTGENTSLKNDKIYMPWDLVIEITDVNDELSESMTNYLLSHQINDYGLHSMCSAVTFKLLGQKYHGIGFKNDIGGFEVRNNFINGFSSKKGITTIKHSDNAYSCCLFRGFMDYLSFLSIGPEKFGIRDFDCMIVDPKTVISKSEKLGEDYLMLFSFLGTDYVGRDMTLSLQQSCKSPRQISDKSYLYTGRKGLNDYLCMSRKPEVENQIQQNPKIKMR